MTIRGFFNSLGHAKGMPVLLYSLLGIIALALLAVLLPLRIRLVLALHSVYELQFRFELRVAYVIPVTLRFGFHVLKTPILTLYHHRGKQERRAWDAFTQKRHTPESFIGAFGWHAIRTLHAKKLDIKGEVGVMEDAALTALLTGALQSVLTVAVLYILNEQQRNVLLIQLRPCFTGDCFRLNLEGIAQLIPAKSIWQATVSIIRSRRKQKRCHTRSKTF